MIEILINPTGEDFERVLNNQIKMHKRNTIADKLYSYYETRQATTVDIPEFCKPVYDQIQSKVARDLDRIEAEGKLDEMYNKALVT